MRLLPVAVLFGALAACVPPAGAQGWAMLDQALAGAAQSFASAQGRLGSNSMGIDTDTYSDAIGQLRFRPPGGKAEVAVLFKEQDGADARCARFAAYVIPAPQDGTATIHLCPQFFRSGTDALRQTTILHEMVHVVAGPDECLAMAYTAQVQVLATGSFQPVTGYWSQSGCETSSYKLPNTSR